MIVFYAGLRGEISCHRHSHTLAVRNLQPSSRPPCGKQNFVTSMTNAQVHASGDSTESLQAAPICTTQHSSEAVVDSTQTSMAATTALTDKLSDLDVADGSLGDSPSGVHSSAVPDCVAIGDIEDSGRVAEVASSEAEVEVSRFIVDRFSVRYRMLMCMFAGCSLPGMLAFLEGGQRGGRTGRLSSH